MVLGGNLFAGSKEDKKTKFRRISGPRNGDEYIPDKGRGKIWKGKTRIEVSGKVKRER